MRGIYFDRVAAFLSAWIEFVFGLQAGKFGLEHLLMTSFVLYKLGIVFESLSPFEFLDNLLRPILTLFYH